MTTMANPTASRLGFFSALRLSGAAAPFTASLIGRLPMGAIGLVFILRTHEITGSFAAGGAATVGLGDDGVLSSLVGMAFYLTAISLLGLGLGVLLRSVASSVGTLIAGVLILPGIAGALLPDSWDPLLRFLPTNAAAAFTAVTAGTDELLSGSAGAATLAGWVIVALGAAAVSITRRDV